MKKIISKGEEKEIEEFQDTDPASVILQQEKMAADQAAKKRKKKRQAEQAAAVLKAAKTSDSQETDSTTKIDKAQTSDSEEGKEDEEKDEEEEDNDDAASKIQFGDFPKFPVDPTALADSLAREEILKLQILQMEAHMNGNKDVDDDDLTTNHHQKHPQSFIYNNDVLNLDAKVNKSTVMAFVNQFRQKEFTKTPLELIYPDAKRLISAKFFECGDCDTRGVWLLWPKKKILEILEKRYHDEKSISDIDTLTKLRDCPLRVYFGKNDSPEGQKLIVRIWKIVEEMTTEELGNYQLQKQFVKLFWDLLSNKDESKIWNNVTVLDFKSLEAFLIFFSRYRVDLNKKIQDLEKHGVKVEPKVFLLNAPADQIVPDKKDKKKKWGNDNEKNFPNDKKKIESENENHKDKKKKTEHTTVLDPSIKPCEGCGRQEMDRRLQAIHTFDNCYLKEHPDANKNGKVPWKDSKSGKAYANHKQGASPILPWSRVLVAGTAWKGVRGKNSLNPNLCFIDEYLSSISSKLKFKSSSSFLEVILQYKGNKDIQKTTAKALLDTGSLAGDFISNDLVIDMNLINYVEVNINEKHICSGLDNNCSLTLGSIAISLCFKNEINNSNEFINIVFKVLKKSPIDIIIGRQSIKTYKMVSKLPSHFFDTYDLPCCHTCADTSASTISMDNPNSEYMCGCQRLSDLLPIEPSVTSTEIQASEITNRLASRSAEPSVVERNMPSSKFAPLVAPWGDNLPSEPRVGAALMGDIPPQSLMAVTQTHTVFLKFGDVMPYKQNDILIYDKLYSPLHETDQNVIQELRQTSFKNSFDNDTTLSALTSDTLNMKTRYIEDDGIDQIKHDSFAPWLQNEKSSGDILDLIYIEGNEALQKGIRDLCEKYRDVFAMSLPKEPSTMTPFHITVNQTEWRQPKNRMPPRVQSSIKQVEISKQINTLLEQGIIEKSPAEYYSQVLLTPKPGGEFRLCVDYRNLNDASESASHPIPNIKHMLNRIGDHRSSIYGVMDLTQGYHQDEVAKGTKVLLAFIVFCGIYQFLRLPFGPKKAPAHFQEQMASCVLLGLIYMICEVYLDDIIVHGKNK